MISLIKSSWKVVSQHFYIVILLFLYQLIWGFFLYRFINSIVMPILARYPESKPTETSLQMFLIEGQFQLMKTDIVNYYLWMLGGMLFIRMLVSPFINAGLLYSMQHQDDKGILFFKGIKYAWRPIFIFYWLETLAIFAPMYWLLPHFYNKWLQYQPEQLLIEIVPYIGCWLIYAWIVHQLFLYMQFGRISQQGIFTGLRISLRHLPLVLSVSLLLLLLFFAIQIVFSAMIWIWTGILAIIVHQAYHLIRSISKVWGMAAQFQIWRNKTET